MESGHKKVLWLSTSGLIPPRITAAPLTFIISSKIGTQARPQAGKELNSPAWYHPSKRIKVDLTGISAVDSPMGDPLLCALRPVAAAADSKRRAVGAAARYIVHPVRAGCGAGSCVAGSGGGAGAMDRRRRRLLVYLAILLTIPLAASDPARYHKPSYNLPSVIAADGIVSNVIYISKACMNEQTQPRCCEPKGFGSSGCNSNRTLTGDCGSIQSMGFPLTPYDNSAMCEWNIQVRPERVIMLTFTQFDLEYSEAQENREGEIKNGTVGPVYLVRGSPNAETAL
ncbi:hypothetical protein Bbelb_016930 [Branchiostoma belcheri]|nr:hypothetical protein Bbelb_016930 [Branchiostoma belcheri]